MDRQSSTVATPDMLAQPSRSTAALPVRRLAAGEVQCACGIAQAVVGIALGQPEPRPDAPRTPARAAAFARQIAMYLTHVGFGLPMAEIGKAFGRDRTTVVHACHLVEDRRDEARFDVLLDYLEQAAAALQAANRLNRQD
jgi:hypothetical protein